MQRKPRATALALAFAAIVVSASVTSAADNWLGTWKLNLTKSKYNPPELAPKSQMVKREAVEGGLKTIVDGIDADGKPVHTEYTAKFDGKDYPWTGQVNADTIALKKLDDDYYEAIWKLKGQVTLNSTTVVSKDGKTLTNTQTGKDAQGRMIRHMLVYERQ